VKVPDLALDEFTKYSEERTKKLQEVMAQGDEAMIEYQKKIEESLYGNRPGLRRCAETVSATMALAMIMGSSPIVATMTAMTVMLELCDYSVEIATKTKVDEAAISQSIMDSINKTA